VNAEVQLTVIEKQYVSDVAQSGNKQVKNVHSRNTLFENTLFEKNSE